LRGLAVVGVLDIQSPHEERSFAGGASKSAKIFRSHRNAANILREIILEARPMGACATLDDPSSGLVFNSPCQVGALLVKK
jgi:hypothetical protein